MLFSLSDEWTYEKISELDQQRHHTAMWGHFPI